MDNVINILWAVNPLDLDKDSIAEVEALLSSSVSHLRIFPVYVASPKDVLEGARLSDKTYSSFKRGARIKLKSLFTHFKRPDLLAEAKVLSYEGLGVEGAVDRLLSYSKKIKTDFILLGLSKKTPTEHKKFGSFSKTLLQNSMNPSIAIGLSHESKVSPASKVLLATDLSHNSLMNLIKFSNLLKQLGSELTFIKQGCLEGDEVSRARVELFSKLAKKCGVKTTYAELPDKNAGPDDLATYAFKNNFVLMGLSCNVLNSV